MADEASQKTDGRELEGQVAKSTATMSMATLTSRITGFLRTWAIAFALGNTFLTSAYQVANNLPNMVYELVAGGILSTAFLPVLMTLYRQQSTEEGNRYASNLLNICLIVLGVVVLLTTIFARQVITTQTFVTGGEVADLATFFFRVFAIQVIFYGASAIFGGILNSNRRFLMPAVGPVMNNIVVIVTMFTYVPLSAVNPTAAMWLLAIGTSVGVLAQCVVQIPALIRCGFKWKPVLDLHDPALRETAKLAIPAIIFTAMNLVCVSVRNAYALGVSDIGPSTLAYAWLWFQLPYGVLAVALSTAMFTEMSDSAAKGDMEQYRENVRRGLRGTFFLIIPMATMLIVLAPLLITLYHAGQFTSDDITLVAEVLRYWAICLPLYAGYLYLYFAFSAIKKMSIVAVTSVCVSVLQIFLYATLTVGNSWFGGFGIIGIPITDCVFFTIMYFAPYLLLRHRVGKFSHGTVPAVALKTLAASIIGGGVTFVLMGVLPPTESILVALVEVVALGVAGLAISYGLCAVFRVEETSIIKRLISRVTGKLLRR